MYKTILVPVDLAHAEAGRNILKLARTIGGADCRIVLLNVLVEIPAYVAAELPANILKNRLEAARGELADMAKQVGAEHEVLTGHPSTTILDQAEKIGAELIIIASHRPGLQDYFLGSTAARVVRHAHCSVLVDR